MMRTVLTVLLAVPLAALATTTPVLPASEPPALARTVAFEQRLGATLPADAHFVDEDGATIRLGTLLGDRPVLLVPAYYECPMLCTLVLNGVVRMLRALSFDVGTDFDVVIFSIDPEETPDLAAAKKASLLEAYRRPGSIEGWHLLTGDENAIRALTEAIGFRFAYDPARDQWAHASGFVVVTPDARVSHYFFGVEFSTRDVRFALVEASENRLGTVVDQLLLLCLQYDPTRGRYSGTVLGAIRVGGALTLLALAAFVWQTRGTRRRDGSNLT